MNNEILERLPCREMDFPEIERWLDQMAEKGEFLIGTAGKFWYFKKGEPKSMRYRLDPVAKGETEPSDEKKADYLAMGWSYVLTHKICYHIFCTDDPQAEELHTDKVVESYSFKRLEWSYRFSGCFLIFILVQQCLFGFDLLKPDVYLNPVLSLFNYPILTLMNPDVVWCSWTFILLLFGWRILTGYRRLRQIKRRLAAGVEETKSVPVGRNWKGYIWFALLALAVAIIVPFKPNKQPLSAVIGTKRLPVLETLDLGTVREVNDNAWEGNWDDNNYKSYHNLLMKNKYELHEKAEITQAGQSSEALLSVQYYEPKYSGFVNPLYHDLVKKYIGSGTDINEDSTDILTGTGFDNCAFTERDGRQFLTARSGGRILAVEYQGPGNLKDKMGILLDIVKAEN